MTLIPFPAPPSSVSPAPGQSRASGRWRGPTLLDLLPMLGDLLGQAPDRIKQKLFDAFDIQALYSKTH